MGMRVDENNVLAIRALGGDVTTVSVNAAGAVQVRLQWHVNISVTPLRWYWWQQCRRAATTASW